MILMRLWLLHCAEHRPWRVWRTWTHLWVGHHSTRVSAEGAVVMGALTHAASMSLPVEVYNCAMGSPDCSQCLGREDLGHLCVWSDGCRLRGPLQPLPGTCPAPEIRTVSTPTHGGLSYHMPACATHIAPCMGSQTRAPVLAHDQAYACSKTY